MACRTPDPFALDWIRRGVERVVEVSDDEIEEAMRLYFTATHNVAEGAGAAALAAALQEQSLIRGKRISSGLRVPAHRDGREAMFKSTLIVALALFVVSTAAQTTSGVTFPEANEDTAIKKPAINYIEGWYTGNAERMESALYPELAKHMVYTDPRTGKAVFNHMGAMTLVQRTRAGIGKKIPKERQQEDISILDHFGNAAVVKIVASDWIDYLEETKIDGEWKIVNVLWELKKQPTAEELNAREGRK